jgi:hypothetical protein
MKKLFKSLDLIMLSMLMLAFSVFSISCEKDNKDMANHTIAINSTTNGLPLQFISLILTPVDGSSAPVTFNFVLNPGASKSVEAILPKTTAYKIEIVSATATIVTWNSVIMDSDNGTTSIYLCSVGTANYTDYCPNSRCNSVPPDGC